MKPALGIGLIGAGFMGRTHTFGYAVAEKVFDLPVRFDLKTVADVEEESAARAAERFGYARAATDWHEIIEDPTIDIVSIATPNTLHKEMALAAIAAGKHVYCEKPLAPTAEDAREMASAAAARGGIKTQVGFNYLCNPVFPLARQMIAEGALGEIHSYRGIHAEDYMVDKNAPWTFRHDAEGGGALSDLGSHALATAEYLLGPISSVMGDCATVVAERPSATGPRAVEVDDIARAFVRFAAGATGSIEANWVATGRKLQHVFEVYGSKGALVCDFENMNELLFYDTADASNLSGFRRILTGPKHPPYDRFCAAAGHHIGFNDLKAIEVAAFTDAIVNDRAEPFGFSKGYEIQMLIEAIQASSTAGQWKEIGSRAL